MARIALAVGIGILGAVTGGLGWLGFAGIAGGAGGAFMGASIGMSIGGMLGNVLFPPFLGNQEGPRLNDLQVSSSANGSGLPFGYGTFRVAGQIIWSPGLVEHKKVEEHSAKGGPSYTTTTYTYTCSFAASFGEGPADIYRIWGDSKILYDVLSPANNADCIQVTPLTISVWPGDNSGAFSRTDVSSPSYTKFGLVGLMFNTHPKALLPGDPHDSGDEAYPIRHEIVTPWGTFGGEETLSPVGTGSLHTFDALIEGMFAISTPGDYTFKVFADDGFFVGIGPERDSGNPVSFISGPKEGIPYATTPKHHYPILWGLNKPQDYKDSGVKGQAAVIHFPSAGWYPFEICWNESKGEQAQLSVVLGDCGKNFSAYQRIKPSDGVNLPPVVPPDFVNKAKYPAPTIYPGDQVQFPDPTIQAYEGAAYTPAFRGQVYAVWTDFLLSDFGNRIPNIRAEVHYKLPDGSDSTQVGNIVEDLCIRAGIYQDAVDTSQLEGLSLHGYVVARPTPARSCLQPLAQTFFFDGVESDGILKFVPRGQDPVLNIPETDLGLQADNAKLTEQIGQEQDLPQAVEVMYADPDLDYQQGKQSKRRSVRAVKTKQVLQMELPMALDRDTARQVAEKMLYLPYLERKPYTMNLWSAKYLPLDPTDVVTFDYEGYRFQMRVVKNSIGAGYAIEVDGVSEDAENYLSTATGGGNDNFQSGQLPPLATTILWLFDLPLLQDTDVTPNGSGYYWAAGSVGLNWPGMVLYKSADGDVFSSETATGTGISFGSTVNALAAPTSSYSWDRVNALTVQMAQGSFASTTDVAVLNGANALLVGNEVIQYRDAVQNSDGSWTLSNLLRGRRGTEWACDSHQIGDAVLDLSSGGLNRQAVSTAALNLPRYYRPVTVGQDITSVASQEFTATGADLKPYAPAHLGGTKDINGNFTFSWVRRTRMNGEWLNGSTSAEVPLNETSELYDLEICYPNGNVKRTVSGLTSPTYYYSTTMQQADFGAQQDSVRIRVYQISSVVGRGFMAENIAAGSGLPPVSGGSDATSINGVAVIGTPTQAGQVLTYDGQYLVWQTGRDAITRKNVQLTTASLNAGGAETGTVALGKAFSLIKLTADRPCRVQLYSTAAKRDADAGRVASAPPAGTEHGVIVDMVLDTQLTWLLSPEAFGANGENPATVDIAYRVTNQDSKAGAVTVTFTVDSLEV